MKTKPIPAFRFARAAVIVAGLVPVSQAHASGPITEYTIPTPARNPVEIVAGPDGNLWFTEGVPDGGIGRITPSGVITEFPLPASPDVPGLGPITAGSDGALWFRSKTFNVIDRITTDGYVSETQNVFSPTEMTLGPDGAVWYSACSIFRLSPNGLVMSFPVALPISSDPVDVCFVDGDTIGITTGSDGNVWFTVNGEGWAGDKGTGRIGKVTPSGEITLYGVSGSNPQQIAAGPDGNLWFTDGIQSAIGRSTLAGEVTTFPIPSGGAPQYITSGPDGNLWFTEGAGIGRVRPDGRIDEIPLSPGSGAAGITVGPDHAIWFTEATGNKIGRLDPAAVASCFPDAHTLCLGIFRITATWEGPGQSGSGNPMSITPNAGAFWFFDPSNVEVFVKILDACRATGRFDVYVNGLTHLGVTVTVTDTRTGTSKQFANPEGAPFSLIFDGSTFACP